MKKKDHEICRGYKTYIAQHLGFACVMLLQDYSGVFYCAPYIGQIRAPVEASMFAQKNDGAPAQGGAQ